VALILWLGCVIGGDAWPRPRDLSPRWLVDRPRVLAVVADPPEIEPGQTATFSALVPLPEGEPPHVRLWFACPDDGFGFGCPLDLGATTTGTGVPDGLIGIEPGLAPRYTAPDDALDGLDDVAASEGLYTVVELISAPEELLAVDVSEEIDFAAFEVAFKRLVVSRAETPNRNPSLVSFSVEGTPVAPGALVHVDGNQPYELSVALGAADVETYTYINSDGIAEERVEEPYVSWYTTDGEMLETFTLYPYLEAGWVSPKQSGTAGTWWAVVRDRRGGMAWTAVDWVVD
jgi:hypothetical protein